MTRLLLTLPLVFFSVLANSQSAPKSVVAGGKGCEIKVVRSMGGDQQTYALPNCFVSVYTSDVVDALSTTVSNLDAQVHATIDQRFNEMTPKLVKQLNDATAIKGMTKEQIEAMKAKLHDQLKSELAGQLRQIQQDIDDLKAQVKALGPH
jgi:hypothetical protein